MVNVRVFRVGLIAMLGFVVIITQLACGTMFYAIEPTILLTPPARTTLPTSVKGDLMQIDSALKQSMEGSLAYNAPATMKLGETKTIQLLMSPSISPQDLGTNIAEEGAVITAPVN
ncbi:MAG: hypothetical protein WBV22_01665, partial [Anaerolineaceae bacterium]